MKHNPSSPREVLQRAYNHARHILLTMIILTFVNVVLFLAGSDMSFLFSAAFPYMTILIGQVFADTYPIVFVVFCIIAAVSLLVYLLCWWFSKKHRGWMIAALVFLVLDFLMQIGIYVFLQELPEIKALLFYAWFFYNLIIGVKYGARLESMPAEEPVSAVEAWAGFDFPDTTSSGPAPLYRADMDAKARILLEANHLGRHICYRRVKSTNELVINGYVYDEITQLFESVHELSAVIDDHTITAGFDGACSYISADGTVLARKRRII